MNSAKVSVVIPTTGDRDSLKAAVRTALDQRDVEVEVVVVMNGTGDAPTFADRRVRVIRSSPEDRGNGARRAGIAAARHPVLALLDDDDLWSPDKLASQLEFARALFGRGADDNWLVSCAITEIDAETGARRVVPTTDPGRSPIPDIPAYLLQRSALHSASPQFQSSTLVFPTALARREPWDPAVRLHQDWEWLLRLVQRQGTPMACQYEPLSFRPVGMADSLTTAPNWRGSIEWGRRYLPALSARIRGDFFLTAPTDRAARAGDLGGLVRCMAAAIRHGRPGPYALAYFGVSVARCVRVSLRRIASLNRRRSHQQGAQS
ncbi:glycosyltransferase [Leifsonia sp. NPDC056824]|uniref:glycosyltransferase n=1 Tax=Leifsonia sp. NPDC056824 TaxID=3345953 RepID=UPI0036D1D067